MAPGIQALREGLYNLFPADESFALGVQNPQQLGPRHLGLGSRCNPNGARETIGQLDSFPRAAVSEDAIAQQPRLGCCLPHGKFLGRARRLEVDGQVTPGCQVHHQGRAVGCGEAQHDTDALLEAGPLQDLFCLNPRSLGPHASHDEHEDQQPYRMPTSDTVHESVSFPQHETAAMGGLAHCHDTRDVRACQRDRFQHGHSETMHGQGFPGFQGPAD